MLYFFFRKLFWVIFIIRYISSLKPFKLIFIISYFTVPNRVWFSASSILGRNTGCHASSFESFSWLMLDLILPTSFHDRWYQRYFEWDSAVCRGKVWDHHEPRRLSGQFGSPHFLRTSNIKPNKKSIHASLDWMASVIKWSIEFWSPWTYSLIHMRYM